MRGLRREMTYEEQVDEALFRVWPKVRRRLATGQIKSNVAEGGRRVYVWVDGREGSLPLDQAHIEDYLAARNDEKERAARAKDIETDLVRQIQALPTS